MIRFLALSLLFSLVTVSEGRLIQQQSISTVDADSSFVEQVEEQTRRLRAAENFGRQLLNQCNEDTCLVLGVYKGSCGNLGDRVASKWCTSGSQEFCCASKQSDCCEMNGGGIGIVTFVSLLIFLVIMLVSCASCVCCPLYGKLCCARYQHSKAIDEEGTVMARPIDYEVDEVNLKRDIERDID